MSLLQYPDPQLTDGIISLRPWQTEDLEFIVSACQDPEISRYSPVIPFPYTEADALGWLQSQEPGRIAGRGLDLAVVSAVDGSLLGAIAINDFNWLLKSAETGYWLASAARGRGYATMALRVLVSWGFEQLGLARIQLTNDPENKDSQAVARRTGFQQEGHLRSHMLIAHSGKRRDSLVWGILPGEVTTAQSTPAGV